MVNKQLPFPIPFEAKLKIGEKNEALDRHILFRSEAKRKMFCKINQKDHETEKQRKEKKCNFT